jgi:hypothetical protein
MLNEAALPRRGIDILIVMLNEVKYLTEVRRDASLHSA